MKIFNILIFISMTIFFINKAAFALETKPIINIAIVDSGADLILFRRQNGAFLGSVDIAINKAKSAVMIPYPTRAIGDLAYGKDGNPGRLPGIATVDFLVPFAGGLPIRTKNGDLLGAIGVSGATGDQDEECAQAALDAIKEDLK